MQDLSVSIIQTNLFWENSTANLANLEEKIAQISLPTDLIILPEMFTTGFTMNAKMVAEPMNFTTFKWMKQQAKRTQSVITGSLIIKEGDKFFNRLKRHFSEEELVELAAIIALENFRSKFNPVFAVESQGFCPLPAVKEVAAAAASKFHV